MLKFKSTGGICCSCHPVPAGLKTSWGDCRTKPWAQVKLALAWSPCEKRLFTLTWSASYLEAPLADPVNARFPNWGYVYKALCSVLIGLKPEYGSQPANPADASFACTAWLLRGWLRSARSQSFPGWQSPGVPKE